MSSNSTADDGCAPGDNLCVIRVHEQAVIIIPTLLLLFFVVTLLPICVLRYCPGRRSPGATPAPRAPPQRSGGGRSKASGRGRDLEGIDAPAEFNVLETEVVPMTLQHRRQNAGPPLAAVPPPPTGWQHGFGQLSALSLTFSVKQDNTTLYRGRLERKRVILRVLKETANNSEQERFLGFTSFLAGLGPHPFLPRLLGVISVSSPLVMVMEELQHADLLAYLWKCRQETSSSGLPCQLTERRVFTMAGQLASALEFLHSQSCIHGNLGARSVLVGRDLTAKLWGLGPAYHRRRSEGSPWELEDGSREMRKWRSPEQLARRAATQTSDVWSFGTLLYEMVTLGDPPFAEIPADQLLQQLQRGRSLGRPASCSVTLFSIIRSCCQWAPQQRPPVSKLIERLQSGERTANSRTVLRVPEPINIEKYLREAGYGEAYNYAVL